MVRFVLLQVRLEDTGFNVFFPGCDGVCLSHITKIHFVLVVVMLSSHHGSMLVSSGRDCAQSFSTNMDLYCIG